MYFNQNFAFRALEMKKNFICLWKLLGDACVLISKLPEKYCHLTIPSWLCSKSEDNDSNDVALKCVDILELGVRCFCHAIALSPQLADLWYDLAVCYNCLADAVPSAHAKNTARVSALSAVKKCLKLNADSWSGLNLLGLLSMTSGQALFYSLS